MNRLKGIVISIAVIITLNSFASIGGNLGIGDKIPDLPLGNCINKRDNRSMRDFAGKWVIIEFWGIYCRPCLQQMSQMEALQEKFGDQVQFILITRFSKTDILRQFGKLKLTIPNLPMVYSDSIWHQIFPHISEPHNIWIDPNGVVRYVTYGYNTNPHNVEKVVNGDEVDFVQKADTIEQGISNSAARAASEIGSSSYYSYLGPRDESLGSGMIRFYSDSTENISGIFAQNRSLLSLFQFAYGIEFLLESRISLRVKDSSRLRMPDQKWKWNEWLPANTYCYRARLPYQERKMLLRRMRLDLDSYSPYHAYVDTLSVLSWVIVIKDEKVFGLARGNGEKSSKHLGSDSSYFRNITLSNGLISALTYADVNNRVPIVDGTGCMYPVTIEVKASLSDIEGVRRAISKYGLDIVQQPALVPVMVIEDD